MSQWPHSCSNVCKMGWRWIHIYRVYIIPNYNFIVHYFHVFVPINELILTLLYKVHEQ